MEYDSEALVAAARELITEARSRARSVLENDPDATLATVLAAIDWPGLVDELYEPAIIEAISEVLASSAEELGTTVPTNAAFQTQINQIVAAVIAQAKLFDGKLATFFEANIDQYREDPTEDSLLVFLSSIIGDWFAEFQWENDRGGVELAPQLLLARFRNVPARKIWVTKEDERVRDFHSFAHLQPRDRDGLFLLGNGESARFPRDPELTAANYFGCRCWMEVEFDTTTGLTASVAGDDALLDKRFKVKFSDMSKVVTESETMSDDKIIEDLIIELTDSGSILKGNVAKDWLQANGFRVDIDIEGEIIVSVVDGDRSEYTIIAEETEEEVSVETALTDSSEDCGCELEVKLETSLDDSSIKELFNTFEHQEDGTTASIADASELGARWRGLLAVENRPTGDGRVLAAGSVTWEEGRPFPVMAMLRNADGGGGHAGAVVAARIDRVWREGNEIWGEGFFESGNVGMEVSRLIREQVLTGLSVDLDNVKATFTEDNDGEPLAVIESANLRGVTITSFGAIQDAFIEILGSEQDMPLVADGGTIATVRVNTPFTFSDSDEGMALVASGVSLDSAPLHPPAEWFQDPQLKEIMPLQVNPNGQIFGVLAAEGSCHIGYPGKCVEFPEESKFDFFHVGKTLCEDGTMVSTGVITINGAHADLNSGAAETADHYNTLSIVAHVRVYRTKGVGLVVAGAVSPNATPEQVSLLRAANISGDWRSIQYQRRLVAILGVATGGFVKPQVDDGALVASGAWGWDFEADEPLGATGINMVRREVFPFVSERNDRIQKLEAQVAELSEFVNLLRSERLQGLKQS